METLRRWALSPLTGERYVRDVAVAPEALAIRLKAAINVPPKRMLGVLKVTAEWVGVVSQNEFVVWERRQHATRAVGRIRGRHGGSRIEAQIGMTRRSRVLTVFFFALFFVASLGVLSREGGAGIGPSGVAVVAAGAVVVLSLFWSASLRQRAALKAFLNEVFRGPEPA